MELKFRKLKANEIDVRVGRVINTDKFQGCSLLLYKDARVDMNILDETVGAMNWQREHYEVKGNLFCRVGIFGASDSEPCRWVFKADCGTESNTEKEKGESSDSFKRACVNWGIGRELYSDSLKNIMVKCELVESKKDVWKVKNGIDWKVKEIEYTDNEVSKLVIVQTIYGKEEKIVYSQGSGAPKVEKGAVDSKEEKIEEQAQLPFDVPPEQKLTLEEAYEIQVKTKDGYKKLKDLTDKQLEIVTTHTVVPEWIEGAKLILTFRGGQK